jgi:hypothetical protein
MRSSHELFQKEVKLHNKVMSLYTFHTSYNIIKNRNKKPSCVVRERETFNIYHF